MDAKGAEGIGAHAVSGVHEHAWFAADAQELMCIAGALAPHLRDGHAVLLDGDLGAGKTCFVQGVADALGVRQPVTSPTFNIMQEYAAPRSGRHVSGAPGGGDDGTRNASGGTPGDGDDDAQDMLPDLIHFDLYRLESAAELEDVDFYAAVDASTPGAAFVEWAGNFPDDMPDDALRVTIKHEGEGRRIAAQATGPRSAKLLEAWAAARV